jgi:hypothetical protein
MAPVRTQAHTPAGDGGAQGYGDTSVPWSARLVQPQRMVEGSTQLVAVDVSGPLTLDMATVVGIGRWTTQGRWVGEPSQERRCVAELSPKAGIYKVVVRVGHDVVLDAGRIVVTGR